MNRLPAQPNKSLIDGIIVLQELAARGVPVSGLELSHALGIEKTRVNRILKTLAWLGIVRAAPGRKYLPGEGMHLLAAQSLYASGLLRIAVRHLEKLNDTGLTVALGVLWRDRVSYLYHHQPGASTIEGLGALGFYPVGRSSIGMMLLAQRNNAEIVAFHREQGLAGVEGTEEKLLQTLSQIRQQGYAEVVGTHCSLAVTVGDTHTALALSGNIAADQAESYIQLLKQTADSIDKELYEKQKASS